MEFLLFLFGGLGWFLWFRQMRKTNQAEENESNFRHAYQNCEASLKKMSEEIGKAQEAVRFQQKWANAPAIAEEMENMRSVMLQFASDELPKDIRMDMEKMGWGIVDENGDEFRRLVKSANDHAASIAKAGRAIKAVDGRPVKSEAAACLLDAFDGYVNYYLVKRNDYAKRVRMVKLAFYLVNLRSRDAFGLVVTEEYLNAKLRLLFEEERRLSYLRQKRKSDEEIRRLENSFEAKEQKLNRELEKLRQKLEKAHVAEKQQLQDRIASLEKDIEENRRAMSNAQLTKRGTVYVLSNVGSFGEGVYKIGMTRRTNPQERVDELGVASVPFPFDVHAFIPTENAPELETKLHKIFAEKKVNMQAVLGREFYRVSLKDIRLAVEELGYSFDVQNVDARLNDMPRQSSLPSVSKLTQNNPSIQSVDDLIAYLNENKIKWVDKRAVGGCLWVEGTEKANTILPQTKIDGIRFQAACTKHFQGRKAWYLPGKAERKAQ